MATYFVCRGDASVTSNTVQCSALIETVDADAHEPLFSEEDVKSMIQGGLECIAVILACWLIKKAIDI